MNNQRLEIPTKTKIWSLALILIGIVCLFLLMSKGNMQRVWANHLHNSYFFLGIALAGMFFLALHTLAYGGWHTYIRRIPEAITAFIPVGLILILILLVGTSQHWHHLYHWADAEAVAHDPLLQWKEGFLNMKLFYISFAIYTVIWIGITYLYRRHSNQMDIDGSLGHYKSMKVWSAVWMVLFAITSASMSWQWIMSIDAHWFSTMFGWYNVASLFVSCVCVIILVILFLRRRGYFPKLTTSHLHDLGKYLFAFSIFWTYLWFSQYMLIWYANIPEETYYFNYRLDNYKGLFFLNLIINFLFPLLVLMINDAKRKERILILASVALLIGHWLDFYLMIMPGSLGVEGADHHLHPANHLGLLDFGMALGYLGLFLGVFYFALSRSNLYPTKDPYLKESLKHHA